MTKVGIVVSLVLALLAINKFLHLSDLDIYKISTRRSYYPKAFARIYQNKLTESVTQARVQLFSYLSL